MSYQVIARKYRPQRFADVVGQEHVTQTLANAIGKSRIAHAYIFCGPRGTGKTTIARIFAMALNCTVGPKADFDVNDPKCVEIAEGRSLDVMEIDGASNNGVEQVRELRETCRFAPAASRFKIYIIDEVHMLSTAAFNALLKTLEEPPAHVKFMFATTDPEKVLATILSRCQRFDLRRIPAALIVKHLTGIATAEGVRVDEAALHAIARGADGGMRDAESTLDQLISFCGNEIAEADVLSMFGLVARGQILALADAIIAGEPEKVLEELDELARNGKDLGRLLADLLNHFRNLLIFQVAGGDTQLIEVSETEAAALKTQAQRLPSDAVTRVMEILTDTEARLRDAVSKKIALEVALLRAIQVRHAVSLDVVLARLQTLRAGGTTSPQASAAPSRVSPSMASPERAPDPPPAAPAFPQATTTTDARPAPQSTAATAPPAPAVPAALADVWSSVIAGVARNSPFLKQYLQKAFPVSWEHDLLTIGFPLNSDPPLSLVDNPRNRGTIADLLKSVGLKDPAVKFVKCDPPPAAEAASSATPAGAPVLTPIPAAPTPPRDAPAPASADAPSPGPVPGKAAQPKLTKLDPSKFKDDPQIAAAVAAFRGRIVQVVAPTPSGS